MRVSDLEIDRIYLNQAIRNEDYKMVQNHFHNYYELFYVRQGYCRFFVDDAVYDLRGGDYLVIPPGVVHYNRYLSQSVRDNVYFRSLDLVSGPPFMKEPYPMLPDLMVQDESVPTKLREQLSRPCLVHIPSAHRQIFEDLLNSMMQDDRLDDEHTARSLMLQLRLFFLYSDRYCVVHHQGAVKASEGDQDILSAAQYITSNFQLPITLNSLAKEAGLSPSYFSKRFRSVVGMGMKEFLTSVRLRHASLELLSTRHSITEVALNNGFSDSNYFKDAFKKMYGMSPRAFREAPVTDYVHEQTLTRVGAVPRKKRRKGAAQQVRQNETMQE